MERGAAHLLHDVAHFQSDLDADFVLEIDERLDLELEPHVEVAHRLGHESAGRSGGRRDHRHAIADVDPGLLLVLHADARIGEHIGGAILLRESEDQHRRSDESGQAAAQPLEPCCRRHGARGGGRGNRRGILELDLLRKAHAHLEQLVAPDFEDLDFEHHLGFRQVLRRDQPLGEPDRVRRVFDHEQVQLLVDEDVAGLHQRADHVGGLPHVGVGEVEAPHHELLVFAQLLRRVREYEDRPLVQDLLLELVGDEDHPDRFLHRGVAHDDGRPQVGAHVLVEDEGDARCA